MKRFRDAGITNLDQWTERDILRFSKLPTDIMKMILSTYLNVSDVDKVCQVIGGDWCDKYHIFQFIFTSRYGGQLWEDLHSHQPGRFPNDKSFLRAYELFRNLSNVRIRLIDKDWNIAQIYPIGNDCVIMYQPSGQNVLNLQIDSIGVLNPRIIPQMAFILYIIRGYKHSEYDMVVLFYDLMERFSIVYVINAEDHRNRYFLESSACGSCGKPDPRFKCGNCGKVAYCGQICQSAHWTEHSCQ